MKNRTNAWQLHASFAFEAQGWMEAEFVIPRLRRALELHVLDRVADLSGIESGRVFDIVVKGAKPSFIDETLPLVRAVQELICERAEKDGRNDAP
jgi:hypothetical protein